MHLAITDLLQTVYKKCNNVHKTQNRSIEYMYSIQENVNLYIKKKKKIDHWVLHTRKCKNVHIYVIMKKAQLKTVYIHTQDNVKKKIH